MVDPPGGAPPGELAYSMQLPLQAQDGWAGVHQWRVKKQRSLGEQAGYIPETNLLRDL